jgi:hypothetical protein
MGKNNLKDFDIELVMPYDLVAQPGFSGSATMLFKGKRTKRKEAIEKLFTEDETEEKEKGSE